MPHLITNSGAKQAHPLYKQRTNAKSDKASAKDLDKTTAIPKSYDAVKSVVASDAAKPKKK